MRIASGVTDQYIYFVAVDSTDFTTRETGLSSFTVYRSRNGGAATAMTTPTVAELSAANMPGVYSLLLDEDMTIDSGDDTQEMVFHITQASMAPVTRTIELYRPKITAGNTLDVTSTGAAGIDWGNVENPTTSVSLSGTTVNTVSTLTGHTAQTGDCYARLGAPAGASVSADIAAVKSDSAAILVDTADMQPKLGTPAGASISADIAAVKVDTAAVLVDTASIGITKNATFSNFTFPMVLTSDHYTAATGKTVTGQMIIDGAAATAVNGTIAEVGSGIYQVDFTSADTNGDVITYIFSATACDDTVVTIKTRA